MTAAAGAVRPVRGLAEQLAYDIQMAAFQGAPSVAGDGYPALRELAISDPELALMQSLHYVHQKQELLRTAKVALFQLIGAYATATGSPTVDEIPGGREAKRRVDAADVIYLAAMRDWARLVITLRLGERA